MPPSNPPPAERVADVIADMTDLSRTHAENIAATLIKNGLVLACRTCVGTGSVMVDSMSMVGIPGGEMPDRCETCNGTGEPTDATGNQCPRCEGHGGEPSCTGTEITGPHKNHGYWYMGHLEPGSLCACDLCGGTGYLPFDQSVVVSHEEARKVLAWGMYAEEHFDFDVVDKFVFARLWMQHPPDWATPETTEMYRKNSQPWRTT